MEVLPLTVCACARDVHFPGLSQVESWRVLAGLRLSQRTPDSSQTKAGASAPLCYKHTHPVPLPAHVPPHPEAALGAWATAGDGARGSRTAWACLLPPVFSQPQAAHQARAAAAAAKSPGVASLATVKSPSLPWATALGLRLHASLRPVVPPRCV